MICFVFLTFFLLSCKNGSQKDEIISLKKQISEAYTMIPTYIFEINDDIDYSQYDEVKKIDSLFKLYEKKPLNQRDSQLLGIAKSKVSILIGEFDKAVLELNNLKSYKELENYKNTLLAISYSYLNEKKSKKIHFEIVLDDFESNILKGEDDLCFDYILVCFLYDVGDLTMCENESFFLDELKLKGKREVIISYFLDFLEI